VSREQSVQQPRRFDVDEVLHRDALLKADEGLWRVRQRERARIRAALDRAREPGGDDPDRRRDDRGGERERR
jgi:hypothetical protein